MEVDDHNAVQCILVKSHYLSQMRYVIPVYPVMASCQPSARVVFQCQAGILLIVNTLISSHLCPLHVIATVVFINQTGMTSCKIDCARVTR